jgi:archaeal flagellar protein FlaJ
MLRTEKRFLLICTVISIIIVALGFITSNLGVIGNGIILSIFLIAFPLVIFRYQHFRIIKEMEEKFPLFLRDVVESIRSGMPFHLAIVASGKIDYGRLSKEVKKMANQLTWGIPVIKVLDQFAQRVQGSRRLVDALQTVRESYMTGGDVPATLDAVADNLTYLGEAEKERKSVLSEYVVLMYAIAFIFVGIVTSINKLLLPIFQVTSTPGGSQILGFSNPCGSTSGFDTQICAFYAIPAKYLFLISDVNSIASYYTSIFFFMSVIVAISSGLVAGEISEGSIIAGVKHSVIMTAAVIATMLIFKQIGLLGI